MPVKKLQLRPGVNRENTRYTSENGWYECDKIRFRQGTPEKIGGWQQVSNSQFLGVCRSLWPWSYGGVQGYIGIGTELKYYVAFANGGVYNDITPIRETTAPGAATFAATNGSSVITVTDTAHGCNTNDFVTFSNAASLGGNVTAAVLNKEYQVTVTGVNTYTITASVVANASDSGNGGALTVAAYQVNTAGSQQISLSGWGADSWGYDAWGETEGLSGEVDLRIWNANNFGEDLIFGPQGGAIYYWDKSAGFTQRGVLLSSLPGASNVPVTHRYLLVSDASRFVIGFGVNDYDAVDQNPMLIRWSDQENAVNWTPAVTNQAGSLQLSHGSTIKGAAQVRQEILVWTDTSIYSLQYLGPPIVWGAQLLSDNTALASDRAWAYSAGVTYWMGISKFYAYDGRVQTLQCDLRKYVFNDFNFSEISQVFATTVDEFNEIWWFYCSANSKTIDKYVVYNYADRIWYYGSMARTAGVDAGPISQHPIAADYNSRLLFHETGVDDNSTTTSQPIAAYISSAEFDVDDGNNFAFIWRVLPDVTFDGSTASNPSVQLTLLPLQNSGSGYNNPMSVGGSSTAPIVRSATAPIEAFTGQVNLRVRGRQMILKIESQGLGVAWQAGAMRIDVRPDGRKS